MKRTFLKVALLSSLMLSMPLAFTSCKDYDDDINTNKEAIAGLKAEMASLKAALEKAQADADAAKQAAAAASDEAAKAKAYADQAAAAAKADAIKQAMDAVAALEAKTATKDDLIALKSKVEAIETGLSKIQGDIDAVQNTLAQLQIQLDAVEKYKELIDKNTDEIGKCNTAINDLQQLIKSLEAKVDSMTTTENLETAKSELKKYCDDAIAQANAAVSAVNKNLVTLLTTQLRSLVFVPGLYVDGIESTVYDFVTFTPLAAAANTLTAENHNKVSCTVKSPGTDWSYGLTTNEIEIDPVNYVTYNLNPTSAVVKGEDLSFDGKTVNKYETRAASATPSVVADDVETVNGELKVGYTVVGSQILTSGLVNAQGQASMFKLNAKVPNLQVGDETTTVGSISSDYAMLVPDEYTPVALAFKANSYQASDCPATSLPDDLWPTLKECIANQPSVNVKWDGSVNLNDLVATHYTSVGLNGKADTKNHKVWSASDLLKYGFSYDFFPIQYTVGSNLTSDTQFIQQDLSSGIVTPCGVTAEGLANNEPTKASIDKNPIVRVRLLDKNKNVALVGFIKLNIDDKAPVAEDDIVIDPAVDMGDIAFGCDAWTKSVDWAYITNKIYQLLNISKADFEANYELQANKTSGVISQYIKSGSGFTQLAEANNYGAVTKADNTTGATTNVFTWTLTTKDQQRIYELANHTLTIYVCYVNQNDPLKAKIYVPMTIAQVTKPVGTLVNKAVSVWYRNGEVNLFNVPQPMLNGKPAPFSMNLNNAWYTGTTVQVPGPQVSGEGTAAYNKMVWYLTAANKTTINGVVDENGNVNNYTLSVGNTANQGLLSGTTHGPSAANMGDHALLYISNGSYEYNNNALFAQVGSNKQQIAELNQTTGVLTYLQSSTFAKALLNHFASTSAEGADKADRTNAQLPISIGACFYNPACNIALKLTNGIYNGYFLRPINIATKGNPVFQDAHANGSTIYLYDALSFSDWRYFDFVGANRWLYAYYDVQGVTVDVAKIESNYSGVWGVNPVVNEHFSFAPGSSSIAYPTSYDNSDASNAAIETLVRTAFGTLTWNNQDLNVKTFQCKIPVKVTYYWGTIYTTLDATVTNTYNKK